MQFFSARVGLCFLLAVLKCFATVFTDVPRTITAYVNETTILPCSITVVSDLPTVEWSKEGTAPNITILYRSGCETFEEKNPEFHHRTNLVLNKLKDGDLSQIIHNLRLSDAGRYQCRTLREKQWKVESTVDLVVVAASEPKLTFVPGTDGLWLQCKAECWSSEPTIQFLDDQGLEIKALSPKREETHHGCFTFTRIAALPAATNRVKCKVSQLNERRETEIFIPDECVRSCSNSILIAALVPSILLMCLLFISGVCYKTYRHNVDRQKPHLSQLAAAESENKELKERLSEKDHQIQNLELKSKKPPAPKNGHPMRGSRSSLNGSKQDNQLPQCNTQNPATSSTSNHPEPDNKSEVEESKPDVPKQNPITGPQKKTDRHKSISALMANAGAASEGPKRLRSLSFSVSHSSIVRSPSRYTTPNRFSVFEHLPDDTESQSLID